jgi:DNA mismatch repair protein MutS
MTLLDDYFRITNENKREYGENTILLMLVGSFFEVYGIKDKTTSLITGSKIEDFSRICELNMVEKNICVGENKESVIMMAGFKDIMIEKYIKKIKDAGFTCVVYTQDENCKNTTRSCAGIFSPGTYFGEDTNNRLSNNITCIWVDLIENKVLLKGKYVVVGVSNIDIYTGKTSLFQFKEAYVNNPTTFDDLERFISIYNPSEVIFISNLNEEEADNVISYADIKCPLVHKINVNTVSPQTLNCARVKNCEKQTYQREILNKFYKFDDFDVFMLNFYENNIACQSFCYLLDFVYQHNPYLVNKISEPVFENCTDRLILANHSLRQLNIIDDHNYSGKFSSVSKMLNECFTPMGKRKFLYHFLNPTTSISLLEKEYSITEHMMPLLKTMDPIKRELAKIKDMSKWERQIFLKKISPSAFCSLFHNILSIKEVFTFISKDKTIMDYLSAFELNIHNMSEYCKLLSQLISSHIALEIAAEVDQTSQFDVNFICKGVDEELDQKTISIKESEGQLESIRNYLSILIEGKEKKTVKNSDYVKKHETEKNCFSLLCTSRRCKLLEESLPTKSKTVTLEYYMDDILKTFEFTVSKKDIEFSKQSAANNFISSPQISQLCRNISSLKISMKDTINHVFYNFVEHFSSFRSEIESIINFVTLIDVTYTKASIALKYNYCRPTIKKANKSFVIARNLRHCLIEHLQNSELYVSNDIMLGDGQTDGMLLYGTNAVGKTSLIRSIGVSIIMAQSGLFVPCTEFIFSPYTYLFTRILGNDNIFKGLSTFAVEMSELRTILRLSNENSLVLGDELCSGTENTSAVSIFVAGIQKLHQVRSSFIFATHLHEIVDYEEITCLPSVVLKHMTVVYDKERDMLIYDRKLKDGPGNSMYGLEVCKSLRLPEDFLEAAFNIRMKYHPMESSMLSLKTSHFNSKKVMSMCEKCGNKLGTEVHHLQHQKESNENGFIKNVVDGTVFHKNSVANLVTLCEKCHDEFHTKKNTQHKKVKTTKGTIIKEV